jgi:hypothetical protein
MGGGRHPARLLLSALKQKVWRFLFAGNLELGGNASGVVTLLTANNSDDIDIRQASTELFLPVAGQRFLEGSILDLEWGVGMICLAGQQIPKILIVIVIEADKYSLKRHVFS